MTGETTNQTIVVVVPTRGLMLPLRSRTAGRVNPGEPCGVPSDQLEELLRDGYCVMPEDDWHLNEEPVTVVVLKAFRFRGRAFVVAADRPVILPEWFATKARAEGLVTDPPAPKPMPALSATARAEIEDRRERRVRAVEDQLLQELLP